MATREFLGLQSDSPLRGTVGKRQYQLAHASVKPTGKVDVEADQLLAAMRKVSNGDTWIRVTANVDELSGVPEAAPHNRRSRGDVEPSKAARKAATAAYLGSA